MSGVKHTPGPWRMLDVSIVTGSGLTAKPVAQVWRRWEVEGGAEETEANAHLIAAAPDLFKALKACLFEIDQEIEQRKCSGNDEDWAAMQRLSDSAHAAIAKAEGRA